MEKFNSYIHNMRCGLGSDVKGLVSEWILEKLNSLTFFAVRCGLGSDVKGLVSEWILEKLNSLTFFAVRCGLGSDFKGLVSERKWRKSTVLYSLP